MKAEQVSTHIWTLKTWLLVPLRVWVVVDHEGVTLVDAGIAPMAKGILQFIDHLRAGPLRRILLTHGHPDHVGAIRRILQERPVPVYAHPTEIPCIEGERPYANGKKAAATIAKGVVQPLSVDKQGCLLPVAGLTPYLTPGHSPGHVVYYHHGDRVLLAGDLFTSKRGQLHRPMPLFTADMEEAVRSSQVIAGLNPHRMEVAHGQPVYQPAAQLERYREGAVG